MGRHDRVENRELAGDIGFRYIWYAPSHKTSNVSRTYQYKKENTDKLDKAGPWTFDELIKR